jgi:hypothetical protein
MYRKIWGHYQKMWIFAKKHVLVLSLKVWFTSENSDFIILHQQTCRFDQQKESLPIIDGGLTNKNADWNVKLTFNHQKWGVDHLITENVTCPCKKMCLNVFFSYEARPLFRQLFPINHPLRRAQPFFLVRLVISYGCYCEWRIPYQVFANYGHRQNYGKKKTFNIARRRLRPIFP